MSAVPTALVLLAAIAGTALGNCTVPENPNVVAASCDGVKYDFSAVRPEENTYFKASIAGNSYIVQLSPGNSDKGIQPGLPGDGLPNCTWDQRVEWKYGNVAGQEDGTACFPIGKVVNQTWTTPDKDTIQVEFDGGQDGRVTTVKFVCGKGKATMTALGELPAGSKDYFVQINTTAACPGGGGAAGWIVVGVFLGIVSVYFLAGFIFLKVAKKKEGREAVPQVEFWTSLPGLVKEGGGFLVGKVRGKSGGGSYESI